VANGRIEWAEHLIELWNSADFDRWFDEMGPEFVFTPDPRFPDAGTYQGEEFRRWMRDWISTWRENRFEWLDAEEVAGAVLLRGRWHLATRQTGGEVPLEDFTLVLFYDRDDAVRPARMAAFFDPQQARRAALRGTG